MKKLITLSILCILIGCKQKSLKVAVTEKNPFVDSVHLYESKINQRENDPNPTQSVEILEVYLDSAMYYVNKARDFDRLYQPEKLNEHEKTYPTVEGAELRNK